MIELVNVNLKYPKFEIKNLNLTIKSGEIVAITGNNANGKTTLVKIIAGLLKPRKGSVLFDGQKKTDQKIGVVLQNPDNQIIFNKVYDDIAFTLKNYKVPKEEFDSRINEALKLVEMEDFAQSETFSLSAGQKQRVVIANMLAIHPSVMIFDEASVYLDTSTKQVLYRIFKRLKKQGVTVIFTTNLIEEIVYADRTIILSGGEVVAFKEREELLKDLSDFRKLGFYIPLKLALIEQLQNPETIDDEKLLEVLKERLK